MRTCIVGPGINQPDPFSGYTGMVGWSCPVRLRDGTMYVSFSAGYWHGSPPTPNRYAEEYLQTMIKAGMPTDVDAPMGGRAMISKSMDNGVTWSKPHTLIDTPYDDRHPSIRELSDGTLLCTFYTYPGDLTGSRDLDASKGLRVGFIHSFDRGRTWEQTVHRLPPVYLSESPGHNAPVAELTDGSVLQVVHGWYEPHRQGRSVIGVFRSTDRGARWEFLSEIGADHPLCEPEIALLRDGRLMVIARDEGDVSWSADGGRTWTPPATFGFRMYAPALCVMDDGTILCTFGSHAKPGGLRAIFSTDGGHTWIAPSNTNGFLVDRTYGYSQSCLMPGRTAYLTYLHSGGHKREDAENNRIWSVRVRVRDDRSGIDLLPVGGNAVGGDGTLLPSAGKPIDDV